GTASLPLDGGWGLRADVVQDAVDALDLVDDARADGAQHVVMDPGPVGRHAVEALHDPDGDDLLEGPLVAHDADALDREQHGEVLPDFVRELGLLDLLGHDLVRFAEDLEALRGDQAGAAHREAGAGEGLALDQLLRQAELAADAARLVLEERLQGLDQPEAQL